MKLKLLCVLALSELLQADTLQFTEYVAVQASTPEYQIVQQRVPYQECYDEQVPISRDNRGENNVVGSILGGAIGGVVGHQIGDGKGNDIATVGGAILGTIVGGNTIGINQQYKQSQYQTRRNCMTKYRKRRGEDQFIGYKNVGYYKGKKIIKYTNKRLTSIPVTITIDF